MSRDITVAEGVGFEPTEACASLVFKTSTFVRSVIPPETVVWHRAPTTHGPETRKGHPIGCPFH
jgi:hypothetical protein